MKRPLPTPERLRELLSYDPETGELRWLPRGEPSFDTRYAGRIAGSINGGYVRVKVHGRSLYGQALAWAIQRGEWPLEEVDHRDMDRQNNRWINLRPASHAENKANMRARRDNLSGVKGVYRTASGRFAAQIRASGSTQHLGTYDTPEEANAAYERAARKFFGEFARAA